MRQPEITVSLRGGYPLDRASLAKLIESFPGMIDIPYDTKMLPRGLLWIVNNDQPIDLPPIQENTVVMLLLEDFDFQTYPENTSGLFSKEESPSALAAAIRQVARGEQYISPLLVLAYLKSQQPQGRERRNSSIEALSDREKEVFELLAQGLGNKAIAARLYLSVRTVEGHLASVYAKLGVHSRSEAMLVAIDVLLRMFRAPDAGCIFSNGIVSHEYSRTM
jgi:DNA-binding CsgD family transcriptional regulator